MSIYPGQVWEETEPAEGAEPERIVITGISPKNGLAFFVSADPDKPAEQKDCSLMASWPRKTEGYSRLVADRMGLYRLIVEAPPTSASIMLVSIDWARAYAAEQLALMATRDTTGKGS